jgi:hypothetical protein
MSVEHTSRASGATPATTVRPTLEERLRQRFPAGARVEFTGPSEPIEPENGRSPILETGERGTILGVDVDMSDAGTRESGPRLVVNVAVKVAFDRFLAVLYRGPDELRKIEGTER